MNSDIHAVLESHGIPLDTFDCTREDDSRDRQWCPGCNRAVETAKGLTLHVSLAHERSMLELLIDEERLRPALEELHVGRGFAPQQIATAFPAYVGVNAVRSHLKALDLHIDRSKSAGISGLGRRLSDMSVEEFDAITGTGGDA